MKIVAVLTFNDVLTSAGLDPSTVRLARHRDPDAREQSIYSAWKTEPELVEKYQAIQNRRVWKIGEFVASFVVTPSPGNETLFIGLYKVESVCTCGAGELEPLTGKDVSGFDRFEMARDDRLDEYKGRLSVEWGPGARTWVQRASAQSKPIRAIRDQEEPPFPPVSQFCTDVDEVPGLPPSWQARLASIKGIYLLVDEKTGEQYVGSAKGEDSFLGRFMDYARTGHGGNAELRSRPGAKYRASILEVVDQQLPDHKIETIESWWKAKLMTREYGLNRNLVESLQSSPDFPAQLSHTPIRGTTRWQVGSRNAVFAKAIGFGQFSAGHLSWARAGPDGSCRRLRVRQGSPGLPGPGAPH